MTRNRLASIRDAIGPRRLAWFGTRGLDALALCAIHRPSTVVSQVAPIPADFADGIEQDCLELRLGRRRDLDRYDIDFDVSREARGLKTGFLARARPPMVIVAYRSAEFLSAASFCDENLLVAFNFHLFQRQFEHKPWVERAMARAAVDIPMVPTFYVRDTDQEAIRTEAAKGPMVGRTPTGSGGAGVFLFRSELDFAERLPPHRDGFVAVSPFLEGATPLNINACVYRDAVAVFGISFQLIGIEGLTGRRFGFCGNDFAATDQLDDAQLVEIERITRLVGEWLGRLGYRGVFGLDLLIKDDRCYVSEVNPRFQASTPLSAQINQALGLPDPVTEHVAAFLDLSCPELPGCAEQSRLTAGLAGQVPLAQAIHRNVLFDLVYLDSAPEAKRGSNDRIEAVAAPTVAIENEAMMFRSLHAGRITSDGYRVSPEVMALNDEALRSF